MPGQPHKAAAAHRGWCTKRTGEGFGLNSALIPTRQGQSHPSKAHPVEHPAALCKLYLGTIYVGKPGLGRGAPRLAHSSAPTKSTQPSRSWDVFGATHQSRAGRTPSPWQAAGQIPFLVLLQDPQDWGQRPAPSPDLAKTKGTKGEAPWSSLAWGWVRRQQAPSSPIPHAGLSKLWCRGQFGSPLP